MADMDKEALLAEDAARDVAAARAEFIGRRDSAIAEYEERINLLDELGRALQAGSIDPKTVQNRVRQLLGDRSSAGGLLRAGRTTVGLTPTGAALPAKQPAMSAKPTTAKLAALAEKITNDIDARLVDFLTVTRERDDEARLEAALLVHLRRAVRSQLSQVDNDVTLLDTVADTIENAQNVVADLQIGGAARVRRFVEYGRSTASELAALGADMRDIKDLLKQLQRNIDGGATEVDRLKREAVSAYAKLRRELDRRFPPQNGTLIERLIQF